MGSSLTKDVQSKINPNEIRREVDKRKSAGGSGAPNPKKTDTHQPGEGIRSMKTSSAFRALNFELYAKPNKAVMIAGGIAITSCILYLGYIRYSWDQKKYYLAEREGGEIHLMERKSRWES